MVDRRAIVELLQRGPAAALATLVRAEGSSYRRVGARLLVTTGGQRAGSISGGCLEGEIVRKAYWKVAGGAVIERYSTAFDDTDDIPFGLGCGGTVDILLEPANTSEFSALIAAMQASLHGETHRIVTVLPSGNFPLHRTVFDAHGSIIFQSSHAGSGESAGVFEETLKPPTRLLIVGAGDDAQPMTKLASLLGWSVVVIDGRAQLARPERFPLAESIVISDNPEAVEITSEDIVLLMTHSYTQDRLWLKAALTSRPRYIGLLGSRHRSALLVSEVAALLQWPVEQVCEQLFAPIGLDLGGDGAEAIALATIAEIQGYCAGKLGHSRRMNADLVFQQLGKGDASRYLQAHCVL